MKKIVFSFIFLSLTLTLYPSTQAENLGLNLTIKEFSRKEEGRFFIRFGLINTRNYDRYNVTVIFKIVSGDKPVGCRELKVTVPANSDGSEYQDIVIDTDGKFEKARLQSMIFQARKRYKIEEKLADCPK